MEGKEKISISWSGGKDSCYMLRKLLRLNKFDIVELHTTINAENKRVGMHGISMELIEAQAKSIGLPIRFLEIPSDNTNISFEQVILEYYKTLAKAGVTKVAFGDIFLTDLKVYRDHLLGAQGLQGLYPLWNVDTSSLPFDFLRAGFKAKVCAASRDLFKSPIVGKDLSDELFLMFPDNADLCGENGEYHSYVYDGPIFREEIHVSMKKIITKSYEFQDINGKDLTSHFLFADLRIDEGPSKLP